MRQDKEFDDRYLKDQDLKKHTTINFYLPHEFGGCGAPYFEKDKYDLFNIFHEDKDLAIIKPRWTVKQEFKVDLPPNSRLDEQNEEEEEILEEPYSGVQRLSSQVSLGDKKPSISTKEGQLEFARKYFPKTVMIDFEKNRLPELSARIEELKKVLKNERDKHDKVKFEKRQEYEKIEKDFKKKKEQEAKERVREI